LQLFFGNFKVSLALLSCFALKVQAYSSKNFFGVEKSLFQIYNLQISPSFDFFSGLGFFGNFYLMLPKFTALQKKS